jgi:hypothetical protein
VLVSSYALLKVLFSLVVLGAIDLRPGFFLEVAVLPFGQSVVLWFVTRRARRPDTSRSAEIRAN